MDVDDESDAKISPIDGEEDNAVGECVVATSVVLCVQMTSGILSVLGYERTATLTKAIDPTAAGGK
jgi:hypothetical protein